MNHSAAQVTPAPNWVFLTATMFGAQFAAAFPLRVLPVLAPVAMQKAGLTQSVVGYMASFAAVGSMTTALMTGSLVNRFGATGTLQIAMLVGTTSAAFQGFTLSWTFVIGSFLAGLCDGLTPTVGNDHLHDVAPEGRRNLLFSVKMLGGPLGGFAAGLVLPQIARLDVWWLISCLAAFVTACMFILIRGNAARWPNANQTSTALSFRAPSPVVPLRRLFSNRHTSRLGAVGTFLAFAQGSWFTFYVSFIVQELDRTLVCAGVFLSVALGAGILARVLIAIVVDILGRGERIFLLLCLLSAFPCFLLACSTSDTGDARLAAISVLFGFTIRGWVGLQHAELTRITPRDLISDITGAAVFLMFLGAAVSGAVFAAIVDFTGSYRIGFGVLGVVALLVGIRYWFIPDQVHCQ